jgi:hypothetical protein
MTCLIIETGSIVTDANSYITAAEAETLLNNVGESFGDIPTATIETYLLQGVRYLESFRSRFQGLKTDSTQSLQWPRTPVKIDGYSISSDVIPTELKMAQALAALEINNGETLQDNNNGQTITSESIGGAISVTYANDGISGNTNYFPLINTYLSPLLKGKSTQVYRG